MHWGREKYFSAIVHMSKSRSFLLTPQKTKFEQHIEYRSDQNEFVSICDNNKTKCFRLRQSVYLFYGTGHRAGLGRLIFWFDTHDYNGGQSWIFFGLADSHLIGNLDMICVTNTSGWYDRSELKGQSSHYLVYDSHFSPTNERRVISGPLSPN